MCEEKKQPYKVYRVGGRCFPLYLEYYAQMGESYPVYPNFTEHPVYTAEGRPFATSAQESCPHSKPSAPGKSSPGDCGGFAGSGGSVVIYGGTITATGGNGGAGIGGGYCGGDGGSGGSVVIIGGSVIATGGTGGAGIGGGVGGGGGAYSGQGGCSAEHTISGGTIIATGGSNGNGIGGGGYASSGGSVGDALNYVITGGSVNASTQINPSNGGDNGYQTLYPVDITLVGLSAMTQVQKLNIAHAEYYGTKDMFTDASGRLFLFLPEDASFEEIFTPTTRYSRNPSGQFEADIDKPFVLSVTPSGTGAPLSGEIAITFNEDMDHAILGAVSLDGGTTALSGGSWSEERVYTIPYSGLKSGTGYGLNIAGFEDYSGNEMTLDASHIFTTVPSDNALLSALTLSAGSLSPDFEDEIFTYRTTVENSVTSLNVTPTTSHWGATLTVNGQELASGSPSEEMALAVGENIFTLRVIAQDGVAAKTYTLIVTRAEPDSVKPTVETNAVSGITASGATLKGEVTSDGGAEVIERGFVYSVSANPTIGGEGVTQMEAGLGTGTFSVTLTGLSPGTTYTVRAYAINSAGTAYGSDREFTTQPGPPTGVVHLLLLLRRLLRLIFPS